LEKNEGFLRIRSIEKVKEREMEFPELKMECEKPI
jgi:hypothetical protein